jgi:hypothetical protein
MLVPQASDDKAERFKSQLVTKCLQIFPCEKSAVMASSNIFLRKDARFGGTQPQLAKRATVADYRPKLL